MELPPDPPTIHLAIPSRPPLSRLCSAPRQYAADRMPPPEQQIAQSPSPVASASAAGTTPFWAGRAASIPASCGLDPNGVMPLPSSGRTLGASQWPFGDAESARTSQIHASGAETESRGQLFGPASAAGAPVSVSELWARARSPGRLANGTAAKADSLAATAYPPSPHPRRPPAPP